MSDIRFNRWLHNSGTGGVYQDSSGRVGIGSSVPTSSLDIVGTVSATTFNSVSGSTFSNGPVLIGSGTSTGVASQRLQVTGGAYVSGNVGLGSTGIFNTKLYLNTSSTSQTPLKIDFTSESYSTTSGSQYTYFPAGTSINISNSNATSSAANLIYLETRGLGGFNGSYIGAVDSGGSSGSNNIVFGSRTGATTWVERVRIDSNGRLGINTTTPQCSLDVYGRGSFGGGPLNNDVALTAGVLGESYTGNSVSNKYQYFNAGTVISFTSNPNSVNSGCLIDFNAYNSTGGATGIFLGAAAGPG